MVIVRGVKRDRERGRESKGGEREMRGRDERWNGEGEG